jgi:hypothetical protein
VTTCGSKTFYYCKKIEEQENSLMEGSLRRQPIKKTIMCLKVQFQFLFGAINPFKKDNYKLSFMDAYGSTH